MKISTRGRYGLRAMVDLAVQPDDVYTNVKSIAERQGISENYLEQLFAALKRSGYVTSGRGAYGGYRLNKNPENISVGDILRVLEGPLVPVDCVENGSAACSLPRKECCVTKSVWTRLYSSVTELMDSIMLNELVEDYKKFGSLSQEVV